MLKDPYFILELNRDSSDDDVRKAYLNAIREYPPEKNAEKFQSIQRAYDLIKTHRLRLAHKWFENEVPSPEDLIAQAIVNSPQTSGRPTPESFRALLR